MTILINGLRLFLDHLLLLTYLIKPLFMVPHNGALPQWDFGCTNFLPTVESSISVFLICHPTLLPPGKCLLFWVKLPKKDPCLVKLTFCFICLRYSILELPAPVFVGDSGWKITSTDGPQHLQKCFPRGPYSVVPWTNWCLLFLCPGWSLLALFLLSTKILTCSTWPVALHNAAWSTDQPDGGAWCLE